jgi:hypothetical protein
MLPKSENFSMYVRQNTDVATLSRVVPAAFSRHPIERASSRYGHVIIADLISPLADLGYHPYWAAQTPARKGSTDHQLHIVRFRKESEARNVLRDIVLRNSSDMTTRFFASIGAVDSVCWNGCTFGDMLIDQRIKHTSRLSTDSVMGYLESVIATQSRIESRLDAYQSTPMPQEAIVPFARAIASLRGERFAGSVRPESLTLDLHRTGDDSVWRRTNDVEEIVRESSPTVRAESGRRTRLKPIKALSVNAEYELAVERMRAELMRAIGSPVN